MVLWLFIVIPYLIPKFRGGAPIPQIPSLNNYGIFGGPFISILTNTYL
jgi:hypothetical protein